MDNLHVLGLHGEIDISQKQWIERELDQIERFGPEAFTILDLTAVRYLDTTFLNALIRVKNRLAEYKPRIRICIVAPRISIVWRLSEITKLDAVFQLFEDVASARRSGAALTLPHVSDGLALERHMMQVRTGRMIAPVT